MKIIKTIPFHFEDLDYEIRVFKTNDGTKVYVTQDGERVNPFSYSIDNTVNIDFKLYIGTDPIDQLVKIAQSDVEQKIWKKKEISKEQREQENLARRMSIKKGENPLL